MPDRHPERSGLRAKACLRHLGALAQGELAGARLDGEAYDLGRLVEVEGATVVLRVIDSVKEVVGCALLHKHSDPADDLAVAGEADELGRIAVGLSKGAEKLGGQPFQLHGGSVHHRLV